MIGDLLYGLTNRDTGTQFGECWQRELASNAAAVTLSATLEVPIDRVYIIQAATAQGDGGGAQTCTALYLGVRDDSGSETYFVRDNSTGRTALNRSMDWSGALYIRGGMTLVMYATFSAGAIANGLRGGFLGYSIPVGNVGHG